MEKIVGNVISKNSNFSYPVKWDKDEETVWVQKQDTWIEICCKVKTENAALKCAQNEIDFQNNLY